MVCPPRQGQVPALQRCEAVRCRLHHLPDRRAGEAERQGKQCLALLASLETHCSRRGYASNLLRASALIDTHLAHLIRNHNTSTARAVAALRATSRWVVSGTPIQNGLADFLGLFTFLRFVPYNDPRAFDDDLADLWRDRRVDEAVETFKKLLSCVMIRRTKSILDLPEREDKVVRLSFSGLEEEYYRRIERPVVEMLGQPVRGEGGAGALWLNAIQQINRLRLVCNLGTFAPLRHAPLAESGGGDRDLAVLAARLSMGGETCGQCLETFDCSPPGGTLPCPTPSSVYHSACHRLFCAGCAIALQYQAPGPCACADSPPSCPLRPLTPLPPTPSLSPTRELSPLPMDVDGSGQVSSKVRALVSQIGGFPKEKQ